MHSDKIRALSTFLARQTKSYNEIAQFLVMNTFSQEHFVNIYIGELIETGVVCVLGKFGWDASEYAAFTDLPIRARSPVTDAIRTNQVMVFRHDAEFNTDYPLMSDIMTSVPWVSGVAIPVYPIGGMVFFSAEEVVLSESMEVFFIAIGSLLGLYASQLPSPLAEVAIGVKQRIDLPQLPLSDRQLVIAGLLERGFSNSQIADEIGFSESLIRQEAIAIYKKLRVTGRKAMQAIRTFTSDAAATLEPVSEYAHPDITNRSSD